MPSSFVTLLRAIVEAFPGSKGRFAKEIGVSPSVLSRFLSGHTTPPIEGCLAIAKAGGVSSSLLLRAAGYDDTVTLLEELYGPPRTIARELPGDHAALVHAFAQLTPRLQKAFLAVIEFSTKPKAAAAPRQHHPARRSGYRSADKRSA